MVGETPSFQMRWHLVSGRVSHLKFNEYKLKMTPYLTPKITLFMLGNLHPTNLNNLFICHWHPRWGVGPTYHLFVEFPEILNRSLPNKGWRPGTTSTTIGWSYKVLGSSAERRFNVSTPRHGVRFSERPRGGEPQNMTLNMNLWTRCISCSISCEEIQRHIHFFNWLGICYKLQCSMDQLSVPLESPFWRQSLQTRLFVSKNATKPLGETLGSCDVSSCFGNRFLQISVGTGIWIYHIYIVEFKF